MITEDAELLSQTPYKDRYVMLRLAATGIAGRVAPGQFVHIRIPDNSGIVLRRPLSVYDADGGELGILYKKVGRGTELLARLATGREVSVMGPLGNGFPLPAREDGIPLLVAGGYGVAPLHLLARRIGGKGHVFIGGATAADVLCVESFARLGWETHLATVDGSLGRRGLVTDVLGEWLMAGPRVDKAVFYACGPTGLLRAVTQLAVSLGHRAWVSMDKRMGCGVGACLACVQKVLDAQGQAVWARVCRDGPVFDGSKVVWDG